MSMPKHDLSSRHFQRKISQFCDLRIAPITSKRVLENIRPFLISLIIYRNSPPLGSGQLDCTAIGQTCDIEAELTVELKKRLRPRLEAIIRWLDGAPAVEEQRPPKPTARPEKMAPARKATSVTSTKKPQRATADGTFVCICATWAGSKTDQPFPGTTIRGDRGSGELSGCTDLSYASVRRHLLATLPRRCSSK